VVICGWANATFGSTPAGAHPAVVPSAPKSIVASGVSAGSAGAVVFSARASMATLSKNPATLSDVGAVVAYIGFARAMLWVVAPGTGCCSKLAAGAGCMLFGAAWFDLAACSRCNRSC